MTVAACNVPEIFLHALEHAPADRDSFITAACAGQSEVAREVQELLAAFARAEHQLEPISIPAAAGHERNGLVGARIGGFHVTRLLASGGMGIVYEAQQKHPRRFVAMKVMKRGLGSRSALRRFEYEAQVLARLRHPNIAQIYEAGTHDDGSGSVPWFAMEFIPGARTLTAFALERDLELRQRLELFLKVCDAIHHGHLKGVIHRDLKPANILIDSGGEPKVIDFGVARAANSEAAVTTIQTETGQLVGTVQYMSPEQCAADPHDIDTRSDVYSLGVVLYELLAGQCPYDVSHTPIIQATRTIIETSPTRLSSIDRSLRGDVETIVLKALEKDRARRYQSAADLANDIRRFLCNKPIVARPAGALYQLRLFARRHRAVVATLAALFLVLIAGIITTSAMWLQARRARDDYARLTDQTFAFLREELGASVALMELKGTLTGARNMIASYEQRLDGRFDGQPEMHALARTNLGLAYRDIGDFAKATTQIQLALAIGRESLGETHPTTLTAMIRLGDVYRGLTDHARAEVMFCEAIDVVQRNGIDENLYWSCWDNYAGMLHDIGRLEDAEDVYHELLDSVRQVNGEDSVDLIYYLPLLAGVYRDQGRYSDAAQIIADVIDRCERQLPTGQLERHRAQREFGRLYLAQGRYEDARLWQQRALDGYASILENHTDNADAIMTIALGAEVDLAQGRFDEAHDTFSDAASRAQQFLRSEQQWWAANFRVGQGICLLRVQRYDEAEPMLLAAYEVLHERLGDIHHRTQNCIGALIELCEITERPDEAAAWRAKLRK